MSKYTNIEVAVPFCGYVIVSMRREGEDDSEVIDIAVDAAALALDISSSKPDEVELMDWETLPHIVKGNVVYAPVWEADIEEVEIK